MRRHRYVRMLRFLPFAVLFIALFGFVVMALWNWLMPALFGLKAVGYWQALGLVILCRILFGGRGPMGHGGRSPPHDGTLGTDDAGGTGAVPPGVLRPLGTRSAPGPEAGR